jgi:hypothetical protein
MPYLSDTPTSASGGMTTAENALMRGQRTYARDIIENQTRNLNAAQVQGQQAASSVASMGGNPFVAQRQAGRQVIQQQGQIRGQASDAIMQRTRELQAQRDREREAEQNRARNMVGSLLQTGGAVASMIPGLGSAIGGAAGAVGGMVSGGGAPQGGGGIGGAIGGLMGAFGGGGQPAPAQPMQGGGSNGMWNGPPAQIVSPAFGMQGAGTSAINQAANPFGQAPPRTGAEAAYQQQLQAEQQGAQDFRRNELAFQQQQRRQSLFAPAGQGGAWWRNGQ